MQIQCHGDSLTRIKEVVNPEILPSEFGGKLGPMSNEEFFESALKHEKMFQGASTDRQRSTKMGFIFRRLVLSHIIYRSDNLRLHGESGSRGADPGPTPVPRILHGGGTILTDPSFTAVQNKS